MYYSVFKLSSNNNELRRKNIIDDERLREVYETWLNDPTVYISADILSELISEMSVGV